MSPLERHSHRRALRPRDLAAGALLLGAPAAVAVCVLFGLGLEAGAPGGLALAAALALVILPISSLRAGLQRIGSSAPTSGRGVARLAATWIWTLAVLLAVPSFAPGQRTDAARRGAEALFSRFMGPLGEPTVAGIASLAGLIGSDGVAAAPSAAPMAAQPTTSSAAAVDPPFATAVRRPVTPPSQATAPVDDDATVVLAYRGDGRELDVEVSLDGPEFGEPFRMIFDTGASFTTVTPTALAEIDVSIPPDAPRVKLNTAGGQIEAPLVLLDAVWMGDAPIEWVTVAACPSCTAPGRAGLLGLNVSSQFRVEIDYDRKRIHLSPSPGDRRHDIRPWLDLRARGMQHGEERLEFEITVANHAPRAIESATVEIDCGTSGYAVQLEQIPARGERTTGLTLPGAERCESFRLDLISAHWLLDRFRGGSP